MKAGNFSIVPISTEIIKQSPKAAAAVRKSSNKLVKLLQVGTGKSLDSTESRPYPRVIKVTKRNS